MFDFLSMLGDDIQARYQTVIRDIKSKSSSFYDAYLDLQEASIKAILESREITYDESRTCGYLLRGEQVTNLFLNDLHVPKNIYDRIRDRTSKVNHHKHHKEKHILPESVIAFMETFHHFMAACCDASEEFDGEYFRSIYGEYERTNLALRQEKEAIVVELEDLVREKRMTEDQLRSYQEALAMSQASQEDLAEQNDTLLGEISALKSLKLSILDQKLSKTIDMLNDLQHYVLESRAIGIAVGKTIIGKDIRETEYMKDAMESVKKRDSVYDMLHQQGEGIEALSTKFSDMDVESLYKAAKQHWDSKNYKAAELYYDKICLLRPLDWRAPFYASLCKVKGSYTVYQFVYDIFPRTQQTFYACIEQIKGLGESQGQAEAVAEVFDLSVDYCNHSIENYVKFISKPCKESKYSSFEDELPFIFTIQSFIAGLMRELERFKETQCFEKLIVKLSETFKESIKAADKNRCDKGIAKEEFDRFLGYGGNLEGFKYLPQE